MEWRPGDSVYTFAKTLANAGTCSLTREADPANAPECRVGQHRLRFEHLDQHFWHRLSESGPHAHRRPGRLHRRPDSPTELACVSVKVTGPGVPQGLFLPITYVQADQINAQMPVFSGTGPVTLQVILNPGQGNQITSDVLTLNGLQPFSPAFFLFPNSTSIAAQIAGTATTVASPAVVPGGRPAHPGEWVTLYGTGFGATNPAVATGQLAPGICVANESHHRHHRRRDASGVRRVLCRPVARLHQRPVSIQRAGAGGDAGRRHPGNHHDRQLHDPGPGDDPGEVARPAIRPLSCKLFRSRAV